MKKHLHNSLRALFLSLAVLLSLPVLAEEIDGINYDFDLETKKATVVSKSGKYSGEVVIPESVVYEDNAYSVTSIGGNAFYWCDGLTSVTIGNSVTSIGNGAFEGCLALTSVSIPNSVTSIGDMGFYGCSGLTSVTIGNSVTSIGNYAFNGCTNLKELIIENGSGILSLGYNHYSLYRDPIGVYIPYLDGLFADCPLETLYLGRDLRYDTVNSADSPFYGKSKLTSVTIGNKVTRIDKFTFSGCRELLDVYCYADNVPSTESNAFYDSNYSKATLHVPAASINNYKATAPWSGFGSIVALPGQYSLTVSSVGYATLYLDFNAEIPEGVKAYVAKEVVDSRLKMELVEGVLPANTGVIIMAEEGTYAFVKSNETPAVIEKNLLKGTVEKTEITAEANTSYYVLSAPDGVVAMYLALLTENKFWNNANKAYLPISNGDLGIFDEEVDSSVEQLSRRLVFDFDDETGIDELKGENGKVKTALYDLSGRRVQKAQKGIFIQNGKVVVK